MNEKRDPLTWLAAALVVAIVLMAVFGGLAMATYGGSYGMMGGSWGWGIVMMAVPGVVLILILIAALGGLREPLASPAYVYPPQNPLEILEQRYARGELARDDYLRIRDDLSHGSSHT